MLFAKNSNRYFIIKKVYLKTVPMLNRIVWNRTVYMYKNEFGIIYSTMVDMP